MYCNEKSGGAGLSGRPSQFRSVVSAHHFADTESFKGFIAVQVQTRIDGQRAALAFIRVESAKEDLRSTIHFMLLDNLSPPRADAGCKSG